MRKRVTNVWKRTLASVLSAVMLLSTAFMNAPVTAHAAGVGETVKIERSEIEAAEAKTYGPSGDGNDIWASFDGDTSTYTNSNYFEPATGKPQVYTITFKETVKLNKVRIHPRNDGGSIGNGAPDTCTVEVSTDGTTYTKVITSAVTDTALVWTDIEFQAVEAKAVKLTMNSKHEAVVATGEVEFYREVTATPEADKTELETAIAAAGAKNEADYTPASWAAMQTALAAAKDMAAKADATQAEVDVAKTALIDAVNALVPAGSEDAKTALKKAYDAAVIAKASGEYTQNGEDWALSESDQNTNGLIGCAKMALDNYDVNKTDVAEALVAAIDSVLKHHTIDEAKAHAWKLVELAEKYYVKGEYKFSVDKDTMGNNLQILKNALNNPASDLDKINKQIYNAANTLGTILNPASRLTEEGKKIHVLVTEMEAADSSLYTAESWKAYEDACSSAEGKVNGSSYDEAGLKTAREAIEAAKAALVTVDKNLAELKKLAEDMGKVAYEDYTRETWRAFKNALYNVDVKLRESAESIELNEFNTLKTAVETSYAALAKGTEGTEYGEHQIDPGSSNSEKWKSVWKDKETTPNIKGGQLYVSNEVVNGDGTTTLTVTWINDGLDPEYGGLMHNKNSFGKPEWSERKFSASEWTKVLHLKAITTELDGTHQYLSFEKNAGFLAAEDMNGFEKEITVNTGVSVSLRLDGNNNDPRTYSLGVYHTLKKDIKEELRKALEEFGDYTPVYMESQTFLNKYNAAVANAEAVLEKESATEQEITAAINSLELHYYFVNMQEHVYHYSPTRGHINYNDYTTESLLPLYNAQKLTTNWTAVEWRLPEIKEYCEKFPQLAEALVKDSGEAGVEFGLNDEAEGTRVRKKQGTFTISSELVNGDDKQSLQIYVRFDNNGINGLTGEEATKFSTTDMKNASIRLSYGTFDGEFKASIPLGDYLTAIDGNVYNGYEGTIDIDEVMNKLFGTENTAYPGLFYVTMSSGSNGLISYPGYYRSEDYPEQYKVTFVDGTTETTVEAMYGETLGEKFPQDPTREDYIFAGWNTEEDGSGEAVTKDTVIKEALTAYAQWKVDKSELEEAVKDAEGLKKGDYTADSWKKLEEALKEADKVLKDENSTVEQVKDALKALNDAKAGLKKASKPSEPSKPEKKPSKPSKPSKSGSSGSSHSSGSTVTSAKTGDTAQPVQFLLLMAAAVVGLVVVSRKKKVTEK